MVDGTDRRLAEARRPCCEADTRVEFVTATASTIDETAAFRQIAAEAARACGADRCSIYRWDDRGSTLILMASQHADEHANAPKCGGHRAVGELPIDAIQLFRQVLQEGTPVLVSVPATDPGIPEARGDAVGGTFLAAVPLRHRDRTIGVLVLDGMREACRFTPEQVRLATTLAGPVALAVENACLVEGLRQTLDDLKTAQEARVRGDTLRALGEMASGAAHHLNNRLAIVLGRVLLMRMKAKEPELRRGLEIVERAARSSAEVVRNLLCFSRVEPVSSTVALDVNDLAREAIELTRPLWRDQADAAPGRIDVVLAPRPVPSVAGDPAALRKVLVNLILNAVEALPQGGVITIATWASEDRVYCAVRDGGTGMPEDVQRRALEPFFTTKGPKAVGLGLSVIYGILQGHGGDLEIESAARRGTTITFRLPIARPPR